MNEYENKRIIDWNNKNRDIEIFPTSSYFSSKGKPIMYGVNWCAKGTVGTEEAREFVNLLCEAVRIAEEESGNGIY